MFEFTFRQRLAALTLFFFLLLGGLLLFFYKDNQGYTEEYRMGDNDELIYVHVCGAVARPGVINVKPGTRKYEVLQKAGGALPEGDLNQINLAEYVLDGEQIYLPIKGETPLKTVHKKAVIAGSSGSGKRVNLENPTKGPYNLNSASQKELENVPGIGPALAERILQYRSEHGRFDNYEELLKVPGIGSAKLRQFSTYLFVK